MHKRLMILSTIAIVFAVTTNAPADDEATVADFRNTDRLVCTWKPGGLGNAQEAIEKATFKLVRVSDHAPIGACVWEGKLTQERLDRLQNDPAIDKVYPDEKYFVTLDGDEGLEPLDMIKVRTEELTNADVLICVWKKGTQATAVKFVDENVKEVKILRISENVPKMTCGWSGKGSKREAIEKLMGHPDIDYVYADTLSTAIPLSGRPPIQPPIDKGKGACYPHDPNFGDLWGMRNIRATQAWCCVQATDVVVAVIDTGVDYQHPDLRDNIWRNPKEIAGNGKDDDGNKIVDDVFGVDYVETDTATRIATGDPLDEHYHGTHVAGTIGAVGNNNQGVSGVCWRVEMMVIRVLDKNGSGYGLNIADGIRYAFKNGAKVINLSLGQKPGASGSPDVRAAVIEARAAGVLCVFAAGNDGNHNDATPAPHSSYPDPNIVAVANITEQQQLSSSSNYGQTSVDLAAPGTNILSTFPTYETDAMKANGYPKTYHYISGTSMATPHVAGALALAWGKSDYQGYTAEQMKQLVLGNTRKLSSLRGKVLTGGTLDIGFLCKVTTPAPPDKPCPQIIIYYPPCYNYCPQYPRRIFPRCSRRW